MKIKFIIPVFSAFMLILSSCSEDATLDSDPFVVAFDSLSTNLTSFEGETNINLVYSETALDEGTFTIQINSNKAVYGVDFITQPEASNNTIIMPITSGDIQDVIVFKKISNALNETTEIEFIINTIDYNNANIQGNTRFLVNSSAALGTSLNVEVGGPNQGNQVFIDLSAESATLSKRDSWDLGFYNDDLFRVTINGALYMATKTLNETDIDNVTESSVSSLITQVAVGTFNPDNVAYVDAPNGNILETAIAEISENNNENSVYLLNLGYAVGTDTPTVGSVAIAGDHRGWKKIRILRNEDNYILQYADLNDTSHQEITITKNNDYSFNHFSFNTNVLVNVEPQKEKWDIGFTVFTNIIEGAGSYGFSDFVIQNRNANVQTYQVDTTGFEYDNFSIENVDEASFSIDQTTIGSNWRDVFERSVYTDRFYILKDPQGNIYKINFLSMINNNKERGYPEFEYELLQ
ncbi:MAG: HmuY family protein [Algibacter sp.]